ncbi:hypothetical protein ExPECSC036_03799 [Escherichia coli]|nr:hypothetical protein ExPECSC036_03799 [Escherichia coli]
MATLTKKERAWLNELQDVLDRCPSPKKLVFTPLAIKPFTCMTYAAWMKSWRLLIIVRRWIGVLLSMI